MQMRFDKIVKVLLYLMVFSFVGFAFFASANDFLENNPITKNTTGVKITDLGVKSFGWLSIALCISTVIIEFLWSLKFKKQLGQYRFCTVLLLLFCVSIFGIFINYFVFLLPANHISKNKI
jgi:hypothetical protein